MLQTFTKLRNSLINERVKISSPLYTSSFAQKGFSLLEMLITIGIIVILLAVSTTADLDNWNAQKSYVNTFNNVQSELSSLRNEAMIRSTTTRMVITRTGNTYTIDTYYSSTPVTTCSSAGTWTLIISSKVLSVHSKYELTGTSAMASTCFYRDGTSSGGTLTLSPIIADPDLKTAVITLTMATGYLDVQEQ